MYIELTTQRGEKISFNASKIVMLTPVKNGTLIVDVNGLDLRVVEPYEVLKGILKVFDFSEMENV